MYSIELPAMVNSTLAFKGMHHAPSTGGLEVSYPLSFCIFWGHFYQTLTTISLLGRCALIETEI